MIFHDRGSNATACTTISFLERKVQKMQTNRKPAAPKLLPGDKYFTPRQYHEVLNGPPPSTQSRHRAEGTGPEFIVESGGRVLYAESAILRYRAERLVQSNAEAEGRGLVSRGRRYQHLPEAREKALRQRAEKKALDSASQEHASEDKS